MSNMRKLANKKKPLTDVKWTEIMDNRIGMEFNYSWHPIEQEFRNYYRSDFCLENNTIIIFFKKTRVSVRLGESEFEGSEPMFPTTLLTCAYHIRYRCTITNEISYGAKIIETDLPIDSFNIPCNGSYVSLLKLLRN